MNTRKITLQNENTVIRLDVNPRTLSIEYPQGTNTLDLLSGEYIEVGERGLIKVDIEAPILHEDSIFKQSTMTQSDQLATLKQWKEDKTKIWLRISGMLKIRCFIVSYRETVTEGDKDVIVNMSLTESRIITTERRQTASDKQARKKKAKKTSGIKKETVQDVYVVKSGDSLWKIAKLHYGNGSDWKKIYDANKKVIGNNPNLIYAGQKLILP